MKWHRVYAIVLRHVYSLRHNFDRIADVFYWPAIDIFVWGLMSSYLNSGPWKSTNILVLIVSSLIFWIIAWRLPYETAITLLDDLWARNLVNIFVTPLQFSEWLSATTIVSGIKAFASFLWAVLLALLFFRVNVMTNGLYVALFIFLLYLTGWTIGFLITALIMRFGLKVQAFAWTLGAIIMPFSAIYYPVNILPTWAQQIALFVPSSYVFENIRQLQKFGTVSLNQLLFCFLMNSFYIIIAVVLLHKSYIRVLKKGLTTLQA